MVVERLNIRLQDFSFNSELGVWYCRDLSNLDKGSTI
jgi:hypothetical protein